TATAMTAGSACATPRTTATLNSTSPSAAIPVSQSHSRPRGRTIGTRPILASANRTSAAAAYLIACAVAKGAAISSRDTPTLRPRPRSGRSLRPASALMGASTWASAWASLESSLSQSPPCRHNGPVSRSKAEPNYQSKTGADFLLLDLRDAPRGGLSDWLAGQLRQAIADGRLPVGGRLPASRVLAEELRVSRGVVIEAYQRLIEDGHAVGRGRAGTVVV